MFDVFVAEVKDNGEYDGTKLVKLIDSFGPALETHLSNEIGLLLSLEKDAQIDWDLLGKTMAQYSKKVADRVRNN